MAKTSKPAVPTQIVSDTSVTSSVNMNINTTDLVDVVLQTSKDALTKRKKSLEDLLISVKEAYEIQRNTYLNQIVQTRCDKVKKLKLIFPNLTDFSVHFRSLSETKKTALGFYMEYPWEIDNIGGKSPLNYFYKNLRKREVHFEKSDKSCDVKLYSENNVINVNYPLPLLPNEIAHLNSLSKAYKSTYLGIQQDLSKIDEQLVELIYNEKGVKAKLIKKSLSGTSAGKNVLQVLSSISGINILEEDV